MTTKRNLVSDLFLHLSDKLSLVVTTSVGVDRVDKLKHADNGQDVVSGLPAGDTLQSHSADR